MEWIIGLICLATVGAIGYLIWVLVNFDESKVRAGGFFAFGGNKEQTSGSPFGGLEGSLRAGSFDRAMARIAEDGATNDAESGTIQGNGFVLCGTILDESDGEVSEALTFYIRAKQGHRGRRALSYLTRQLSPENNHIEAIETEFSASDSPKPVDYEEAETEEKAETPARPAPEPAADPAPEIDTDADIAHYRQVPVLAFTNASQLLQRDADSDRQLAFRLFRLAGQGGYTDGYVWCGLIREQDGGPENLRDALDYYFLSLKGALGGQAITQLARHFASGELIEKDTIAAAQCYARLNHVFNVSEGALAEAKEYLESLDDDTLEKAFRRELDSIPNGLIQPRGNEVEDLITLVGDVNNARGNYAPPNTGFTLKRSVG